MKGQPLMPSKTYKTPTEQESQVTMTYFKAS
jgi:hypothetical protein